MRWAFGGSPKGAFPVAAGGAAGEGGLTVGSPPGDTEAEKASGLPPSPERRASAGRPELQEDDTRSSAVDEAAGDCPTTGPTGAGVAGVDRDAVVEATDLFRFVWFSRRRRTRSTVWPKKSRRGFSGAGLMS